MGKKNIFRKIEKTGIYVEKIMAPAIIILAFLMVLDVSYGVFTRYVLNNTPSWTEELARYFMIWMALLATSICQRRDEHVYITFIIDKLPGFIRKIIKVISLIAIFYFFYIMFTFGITMVQSAKTNVAISLGISMSWPLLIIPITALANMIQVFLQILMQFRSADFVLEIEKEKQKRKELRIKRLEKRNKEVKL